MADLKEDRIDFGKLEKELFAAVEADAAYWRENDAKLRAMDQRVESYDQFRDMVAAAHIKPLDKKDKIGQGKRNQPWNPFSSSNSSSSSSSNQTTNSQEATCAKGRVAPKNGYEFTKQWQKEKKSSANRYTYLLELGGENLARIFRAEISFGFLGEIIAVLEGQSVAEDCGTIAEILMSLSRSGRFGLSLDFLSKSEKQTLEDLVGKLEKWTENQKTPIPAETKDDADKDGRVKEMEKSLQEEQSTAKDEAAEEENVVSCDAKLSTSEVIELLRKTYKLNDS